MFLKPSEIFYTQDSISNYFGNSTSHSDTHIGDTLDELINGTADVTSIPTISVFCLNGKWFTQDNRRLWVFRKAEKHGILHSIPVYEISICEVDPDKFTSCNEGSSVSVRGNAGGKAWRRLSKKRSKNQYQNHYSGSLNGTNSDNYPETTIHSGSADYTYLGPTYTFSAPTRRSSSSLSDYSRPERPYDYRESLNVTNSNNYPETTIHSGSTDYTFPAPTYTYSAPTRRSSSSLSDHSRSERPYHSKSGLPNYSGQSSFDQTTSNRYTTEDDRNIAFDFKCVTFFVCMLIFLVLFYFKTY